MARLEEARRQRLVKKLEDMGVETFGLRTRAELLGLPPATSIAAYVPNWRELQDLNESLRTV